MSDRAAPVRLTDAQLAWLTLAWNRDVPTPALMDRLGFASYNAFKARVQWLRRRGHALKRRAPGWSAAGRRLRHRVVVGYDPGTRVATVAT